MRALKSVLVMAGKLKRDALDKPEDVVLMRALRDMNLPNHALYPKVAWLRLGG